TSSSASSPNATTRGKSFSWPARQRKRRCARHDVLGDVRVPGQTGMECMVLMPGNRLHHLPILDGGKLIGLISIADLVKDIIEQKFIIEQLEHYTPGERT